MKLDIGVNILWDPVDCGYACRYSSSKLTLTLKSYKHLNCVDISVQGLDIVGVETVINYHCPNDITMWVLITNIASFESFLCILFDLVHV